MWKKPFDLALLFVLLPDYPQSLDNLILFKYGVLIHTHRQITVWIEKVERVRAKST